MAELPGSDRFDQPNTSLAMDVDLDGVKEMVVGTYSGNILFYKEFPNTRSVRNSVLVSQSCGLRLFSYLII